MVALCAYLLGARRGWDRAHIANVMGSALPADAMVILVAGAGGVFGKGLVASGIGDAIADDRRPDHQAGILAPLLQRADLSTAQLALVALAMGAGGLAVSHINEAGQPLV